MKKTRKILIADDERFIRKLTTRILKGEGFDVIPAENGTRAIDLFNANSDDIFMAVLDIRMPDITGIDVYRHIYSNNPNIRVILCSGYGDDDVPPDCRQNFIQKPFSLGDFVSTVRRVLEKSDEEIRENNSKILSYNRKDEDIIHELEIKGP